MTKLHFKAVATTSVLAASSFTLALFLPPADVVSSANGARRLAIASFFAQGCVAITRLLRQLCNDKSTPSFRRAHAIHQFAVRFYTVALLPFIFLNWFVPRDLVASARVVLTIFTCAALLNAHLKMNAHALSRLYATSGACSVSFTLLGLCVERSPASSNVHRLPGALAYAVAAIFASERRHDSSTTKVPSELWVTLLVALGNAWWLLWC